MKPLLALVPVVLASCTTEGIDKSVSRLLSQRQAFNGQLVRVEGIFGTKQGFANIYSRNRRQCVGLLTHTVDPGDYAALEGRHVQVEGRLMAEGCARKGGPCGEQLCGPTILYNVRVELQPR